MSDYNRWVLIANGGVARLIKNPADESRSQTIELDARQVKTSDLMSDRAGRTFSAVGSNRAGLELHSDPIRHQERLFARHLSSYLTDKLARGELDALYVAASPRTLGDLRAVFPQNLQSRVVRQIDKDFTGLSGARLHGAVQQLIGR